MNWTVSVDDERFLDLKVFNRSLTKNHEEYKLGQLQNGGFIIADLQNQSLCRQLTDIISKCQSEKEFPIFCIADEDDDAMSSIDSSNTKLEKRSQKKNIENSDETHTHAHLSEFFKNNTFRQSCRCMVSITATPIPVILQQNADAEDPIYLFIKNISKYPNYHGWNGSDIIQCTTTEPIKDKSMTIFEKHDSIFGQMCKDISQYLEHHHTHINVLLTSYSWKKINDMETLQYDFIRKYGGKLPFIGFTFHSRKGVLVTFNAKSRQSQTTNATLFTKLAMMDNTIRQQFPDTFDKIENTLPQDSQDSIYQWKLFFKTGKKTLAVLYDVMLCISNCLNIEKPIIVCISSTMADRGFTFKDSNHKYYVTHVQ